MVAVIVIIYSIWAIYSGYKIVSGRSQWLDKSAPLNFICKWLVILVVGYLVGAFYFIYLILRFLGIMSNM